MNKNFSLIISGIALAAVVWFAVDRYVVQKPVAYIRLQKVFGEFEMSKEYEKKLSVVKNARQTIIDSMTLNLKSIARQVEATGEKDKILVGRYLDARDALLQRKEQFDEDNTATLQEYNNEINKQISQYTQDYGKEHKFKIIFGADGSGTMMYAEDNLDITEKVIQYINKRYAGKRN